MTDEAHFTSWLENNRPHLYAEYVRHVQYGEYASWLRYLWCDGDSYEELGAMQACPVSIGDRRAYFRTAVAAVVSGVSFDDIDFNEDTSPVYCPEEEDGQLKLSALLGLVHEYTDVLYIGSGAEDKIKKRFAQDHKLQCLDIFGKDLGTLAACELTTPCVVNDAYYLGFKHDQERLKVVEAYVAKQAQVQQGDFLVHLPGHVEPRYTNIPLFKNVFTDMLSRSIYGTNRDQIVIDALVHCGVPRRYFDVERTLLSRITHEPVLEEDGEVVPYKEFALCLPFERVRVDKTYVKGEVVSAFRRQGVSEDFRAACRLLLDYKTYTHVRKDKKRKARRKSWLGKERKYCPL